MQILCLGLSHQTAPIELRERLRMQARNGNATEYLQTARHFFGLGSETSECSAPEDES